MNQIHFYTTGYLGDRHHDRKKGKVVAFEQMIEQRNLVVIDIRIRPWSMAPCWRKEALAAMLGPQRYRHVGELGNKNYKNGGEIAIVDRDAGLAKVLQIAEETGRVPLLLCGCEEFEHCHRSVVAAALTKHPAVRGGEELRLWD